MKTVSIAFKTLLQVCIALFIVSGIHQHYIGNTPEACYDILLAVLVWQLVRSLTIIANNRFIEQQIEKLEDSARGMEDAQSNEA